MRERLRRARAVRARRRECAEERRERASPSFVVVPLTCETVRPVAPMGRVRQRLAARGAPSQGRVWTGFCSHAEAVRTARKRTSHTDAVHHACVKGEQACCQQYKVVWELLLMPSMERALRHEGGVCPGCYARSSRGDVGHDRGELRARHPDACGLTTPPPSARQPAMSTSARNARHERNRAESGLGGALHVTFAQEARRYMQGAPYPFRSS